MSGHSKWNNIKNRKGAQDIKRGKIFSQLSRQIRAAVKSGGSGDANSNPGLRLVLDKARSANMPKEKVEKAINVALGNAGGVNVQEVVYEGFAAGGVAMMIVALTDNTNRTGGEIRNILSKNGGSLGSPGCAQYMFERDDEGGFIATIKINLDEEQQQVLLDLIDKLRENDDVEDIFVATDLPQEEE